jgi:epoxyqueuosine reductase
MATPDLIGWLSLSEEEFRRRFRDTALLRTGRSGLLRNIAIVLGNTGAPAAIPALERTAGDPDPVIAEACRWAIKRIEERASGSEDAPNVRHVLPVS